MKLLIVEDEPDTREGILHIEDWKALGIEEVYTAENGEKGLQVARIQRPEIILTDIRMPRMDGITMGEKLREILPHSQIIFLSAYEEIDYYKAAIRLNAVNYVEKPVSAKSISKAISEAVRRSQLHFDFEKAEADKKRKEREEVALKMTTKIKDSDEKEIEKWEGQAVTTMLLWFSEAPENLNIRSFGLEKEIMQVGEHLRLQIIGGKKNDHCLVFQIFSQNRELSDALWKPLTERMAETLKGTRYYIIAGKTVENYRTAYISYQSAVILLQSIFYEKYGTVRRYEKEEITQYIQSDFCREQKEKLLRCIDELNQEEIILEEQKLYEYLKTSKSLLFGNVRAMYAAFLFSLDRKAEIKHIRMQDSHAADEWISLAEKENLDELHRLFKEKLELLFEKLQEVQGEQTTILQIREYISHNYQNPQLSLKDISTHVHMSNSHMCTMFKKETSVTINQYLTDFRLERAKYYLKNTEYSIVEISQQVGYNDGSYFGRIFRKNLGLTPVEYREECRRIK